MTTFFFFFSDFFFLVELGFWTQSFPPGRQKLYCLSHTSRPFCSCYFGDKVLLFSTWTLILLFYAFCSPWDQRITPPSLTIGWDGVSWTFLPRLVWYLSPLDLSFQVARITDANHGYPASNNCFTLCAYVQVCCQGLSLELLTW
jgi:hypothetical protein